MEGYVVESEKGTFLSRTGFWFPHDRAEEAWIYTLDELRSLDISNWQTKPSKAYAAKLDDSGQTVITGLAINFNKLVCVIDKTVFQFDPILGCPFDDSEMQMVQNWKGFSIGNTVEFQGLNDIGTTNKPWVQGQIIAIGENAKYLNGDPFVAFAVKVGETVHFKTHRDIHQTI